MQPHDLESVAAALEIPFAARREQQYYTHRGGRRVNAVRNGGAPSRNRRLDVTDHILAARLRGHLNLPTQAIGVLLGVDRATISHATTLTAELLAAAHIPLPPTTPPPAVIPRTPAELLRYAAAASSALHHPGKRPDHAGTLQTTSATARDTPETANLKTDAAYALKMLPILAGVPRRGCWCGQRDEGGDVRRERDGPAKLAPLSWPYGRWALSFSWALAGGP